MARSYRGMPCHGVREQARSDEAPHTNHLQKKSGPKAADKHIGAPVSASKARRQRMPVARKALGVKSLLLAFTAKS